MLKDKIISYFSRNPDLRALFLFDPQKEHDPDITVMDLPEIQKIRLENNAFNIKVQLHRDPERRYFIYVPASRPEAHDDLLNFPLLDVLIANKELRLDDLSEFMEEHGLKTHHRSLVKKYISVLRLKKVQDALGNGMSSAQFNEDNIVRGILSSYLGFRSLMTWEITLAKLLTLYLPSNESDLRILSDKVQSLQLLPNLNQQIKRYFDTEIERLDIESLERLIRILKYNILLRQVSESDRKDPYAFHYQIKEHTHQVLQELYRLHEAAIHDKRVVSEYRQAIGAGGQAIYEERVLKEYGLEVEYGYYTDELILAILQMCSGIVLSTPEVVQDSLNRLNEHVNETPYQYAHAFLHNTSQLISQISEINSYVLDSPGDYVNAYMGDWYLIDQSYRHAVLAYRNLSGDTDRFLSTGFDNIKQEIDRRYDDCIELMNREWLRCLHAHQFDYSKINVPAQYDFFEKEVKNYPHKTVVIISDALRYEIGKELVERLQDDPKNSCTVSACIASIPSVTRIGMANLLPGRKFEYKDGKAIIDGLVSDSPNREQILQKSMKDASVVQFQVMRSLAKSVPEIREIFKTPLVYVYHNAIDAIGDVRASQSKTFSVADEAITELTDFITKLHSTYNVGRVIVTADHGFLYSDSPMDEADLEVLPEQDGLETHNRYEIVSTDTPVSRGYKIPLGKTSRFGESLWVIIPASTNRYRKQGVGHQYVHGGGSLQELLVPVIESTRSRVDTTQKVSVEIANKDLRVVSNSLMLQLVQTDPVSKTHLSRTIQVGLFVGTHAVTPLAKVVLDSDSDHPRERQRSLQIMLLPGKESSPVLTLRIFDASDLLNPLIEKEVINTTLIQPDF